MNKPLNNEVDLYKILMTLKDGRKLLSIFILISLVIGIGLVYIKAPVYISDINVDSKKNPIIFNSKEALLEFERNFYSRKVFEDWKQKNNSSINFDDFSREAQVNRFVVSRSTEEMANFIIIKKNAVISITSNDLSISNQFYNYSKYVNNLLNPKLIYEAERKLKLIEKRYKGQTIENQIIIEKLSSLDRYISRLNEGFKVLEVRPPTVPIQVDKPYRTIGISLLIGLIIGIFTVLLRQAIQLRKNK